MWVGCGLMVVVVWGGGGVGGLSLLKDACMVSPEDIFHRRLHSSRQLAASPIDGNWCMLYSESGLQLIW